MKKAKTIAPIIITFIWIGFICSISFMEAPIKFSAPHLSLKAGVEVGRIVFKALNKIEIILGFLTLLFALLNPYNRFIYTLLSVILLIVLIQSVWLLPQLHKRVQIIIEGGIPPPSQLHITYIIFEVIKVIILFALGIQQINQFKQNSLKEFL